MQFEPPTESERLAAIGPTAGLPPALQRALAPGADFVPLPAPGPHDWLANHPEPGQTFAEFVRSRPLRPDQARHKLCLQPLGEFDPQAAALFGPDPTAKGEQQPLETLRRFAATFFMLDVEVLPPLPLDQAHVRARRNPCTGRRQLLTGDILRLLRRRLPDDAFALLGITMVDLYPEESWNFVFGQASLRERVGVYSFARYDPRFHEPDRGALTAAQQRLVLRRGCRVLAHESAHMFGLQHCIYYRCVMNGSNHLAECDARPLHLCPVDLRKLQASVGFDVVERYRRLREFWQALGFADEAEWLTRRLEKLQPYAPHP